MGFESEAKDEDKEVEEAEEDGFWIWEMGMEVFWRKKFQGKEEDGDDDELRVQIWVWVLN